MIIAIGNDHSAVALKNEIKEYVESFGHTVVNYGTDSTESCNYAEYAAKVAHAVADKDADAGIIICGTGIGVSIAANKVKGIRCAHLSDPLSAKLTKEHNNSNVITFGARIIGPELAKDIVAAWLNAEFQGGRHQGRIDFITAIENGEDR